MAASAFSRRPLAWAFYDWANSAFILSVITVFYGGFFESYWYDGSPGRSLFWQGLSVTGSSLIVAILSPFLGAIAARGAVKKRWLLRFVLLGSGSTLLLALLPAGAWEWALLLRLTASLGFFGSLVFYDALLPEVSSPQNRHIVSGLGFSLGYLGSVALLLVQVALFNQPSLLGLPDPAGAVQLAFVSVALWWILFTVPLIYLVEEAGSPEFTMDTRSAEPAWKGVIEGLRVIQRHRPVRLFLIAYFFYIDGVNTLMQMVSGFAGSVGVPQSELIGAIIVVQIVGVPFALLVGWLGQKLPPRLLILACIGVYLLVTLYAFRFAGGSRVLGAFSVPEIYLLGFLIGMVQGGLQSLSRSYFANIIPRAHSARLFGFYNMLGKGGAIMGPFMMGLVGMLTGDPRWGMLTLSVSFFVGAVLLLRVPRQATEP